MISRGYPPPILIMDDFIRIQPMTSWGDLCLQTVRRLLQRIVQSHAGAAINVLTKAAKRAAKGSTVVIALSKGALCIWGRPPDFWAFKNLSKS